jgi:hypothetical protein
MNERDSWLQRLALIVGLVERSPKQTLGRVAIVKLAYLLQVLRRVPLGYDFRLYTYGPFDAAVLNDLGQAEAFQAVTVRTVEHAAGYGYEVRPGPAAEVVKARAQDWLGRYQEDVDWVVREFGDRTASELELLSTIVYVDRELAPSGRIATVSDLAQRVREVKPHFGESYVTTMVLATEQAGLLSSLAAATVR